MVNFKGSYGGPIFGDILTLKILNDIFHPYDVPIGGFGVIWVNHEHC